MANATCNTANLKYAKRYRNFMIKTTEPLPNSLTNKARVVAKYEKDGDYYYHVGMFASYTQEYMLKQSGFKVIGISLSDIKEYTFLNDLVFGMEKVKRQVLQYKAEHERKLKRGKLLTQILENDACVVDMIPLEDQHCLTLYTDFLRSTANLDHITLKPWQESLLQELTPTDRKIIWIYGSKGGEGKTWIQKHIETIHGRHRVHLYALTNRLDNMCYALSKERLMFKDIFLFNVARSDSDMHTHSEIYGIIEGIKDGYYFSGKYTSKQIYFKTPNTVIVFANKLPIKEKVSHDRWCIFRITENSTLEKV